MRKRLTETAGSEQLIAAVDLIGELRTAHLELMLAAMNSIVEKREGKVGNQQLDVIRKNIALLTAKKDDLANLTTTPEEKKLVEAMNAAVGQLDKGIRADLVQLIEEGALKFRAIEAAFAKIDDDLDAADDRITDTLDAVEASVRKREIDWGDGRMTKTLELIARMRVTHLRLMLAATNSIVDYNEGQVEESRMTTINETVASQKQDFQDLLWLVEDGAEKERAETLGPAMDTLADGIRVDLIELIEQSAKEALAIRKAFVEIEAVLDEHGLAYRDSLAALDASVRARLATAKTSQTPATVDLIGKTRTAHLKLMQAAGIQQDLLALTRESAMEKRAVQKAFIDVDDALDEHSDGYRDSLASLTTSLRDRLNNDDTPRMTNTLDLVTEMRASLQTVMLAAMDSIVDRNSGKVDAELMDAINRSITFLTERQPELVGLAQPGEEKLAAESLAATIESLARGIRVDLVKTIEKTAVEAQLANRAFVDVDNRIDGLGEKVGGALESIRKSVQAEQREAAEALVGQLGDSYTRTMAGIAVTLLVVVGFLFYVARGIVGPLNETVEAFEAVAAGDYSQRLEFTTEDEIGRLATALNTAAEETGKAMQDVKDAAQREQQAQTERAEEQRKTTEAEQKRRDEQAEKDRQLAEAERKRQQEQAEKDRQLAAEEAGKAEILRNKVDNLLTVVGAAAQGDLTKQVTVEGDEAIDELAVVINKMLEDLSAVIGQVAESAAQFGEGSRVIAESSQSLASGAQEQSSSVEEVSASIEELTASIDGVKNNAHEADTVAKNTNRLAEQGGAAVQKSTEAMELIRTSSDQIAEIIQVISEISSQTNLLALNAAIEAARAGEHGMGFAVVADEVRKLAERSNQAAGEITSLIKESSQRVEEGATLSDETGNSLKEIIEGVEATVSKITEIAAATIEQAAGAEEVAKAIQGISEVTERTAAGSEEMASSSEQLGAQATGLRDLVAHFKTDDSRSSNQSVTA